MKKRINSIFAFLSLLLLFFLALLSTPLHSSLSFSLSLIILCMASTGLFGGAGWALLHIFRSLPNTARTPITINGRQAAVYCLFLSWMALGIFVSLLQGMFAPTWVRSETLQGKTYDILDESFLDPACRVTQRHYVFWAKDITGLENHCNSRAVTLKKTPQGLAVWTGTRWLGKAPAP